MSNPNDFEIHNGVLKRYQGKDSTVLVPEGVRTIGQYAFAYNAVKRVHLPQSLVKIEGQSFCSCRKMEYLGPIPSGCKLPSDVFGDSVPSALAQNPSCILEHMTDAMLKSFSVNPFRWERVEPQVQKRIFATRQSPAMQKAYRESIQPEQLKTLVPEVYPQLLEQLSGKPGAKVCGQVGLFLQEYHGYLSDDQVQQLYALLKSHKTAAKALGLLRENVKLMERLGSKPRVEESLPQAEKRILQMLLEKKQSLRDLEGELKKLYGISFGDLPELWYCDGSKAAPCVLAWLLTAHEALGANMDVEAAYRQPGICPEAKELLPLLNMDRLRQAMLALACAYLGKSGRSKKMFLAYPICRYADEALMADLCAKAPKWSSKVSGNDAPPLYTFRKACLYSQTRSAMLLADRFEDLEQYAQIRGSDPDTIRDLYLSDVGLDGQGGKTYDLGNQRVTVRLQKDLGFLVELPGGKTAKSLPRKGSDPQRYADAAGDFQEMKKDVKKILKNRAAILFRDFLEGRARQGAVWKESYLKNPLLRQVASLLVWEQENCTFTLTDRGAVTAEGGAYTVSDGDIVLAHPMDLGQEALEAWQNYFVSRGLKQPFEQIWEPVVEQSCVAPDRYAGCRIPYYRFAGREKHGIHVEDWNFHEDIDIYFEDCEAAVNRIDRARHAIEMEHRFEVETITYKKFTRKVNHILAYLDKVTILERIKQDDVSVAAFLPRFTLAQIAEFIQVAAQNHCTNVTAVLLDYRNRSFADVDPMAEFSLDL